MSQTNLKGRLREVLVKLLGIAKKRKGVDEEVFVKEQVKARREWNLSKEQLEAMKLVNMDEEMAEVFQAMLKEKKQLEQSKMFFIELVEQVIPPSPLRDSLIVEVMLMERMGEIGSFAATLKRSQERWQEKAGGIYHNTPH